MNSSKLAKKTILNILEALDYDIYKQFAEPELSEDPEYATATMKELVRIMEDLFKELNEAGNTLGDVDVHSEEFSKFNAPQVNEAGRWYVGVTNSITDYLHFDGNIYFSTRRDIDGKLGGGYYATEEEALAAIDLYNSKHG